MLYNDAPPVLKYEDNYGHTKGTIALVFFFIISILVYLTFTLPVWFRCSHGSDAFFVD